ncbi:hypothetical protein Nepgr_018847 [Nepenthes gracilis]|uniref:Uncharacterized protein n=1 Tax=Nepenthes gracilis TaxID=150966 RepID=A0AAD3SU98_NEPGR|nr:hypothetical protein Nepgr_018847 [Nepenthes gracilis]
MEGKPQQQILTEIENENLSDGRFVETTQLYKHLSEEVAFTSAVEDEQQEFVRKHQQYKLLSSSILQPVVPKYENNQEYGDGIRWDGHVGGTIGETLEQSTWEMDTLSGFGKGRSSLRSRCNHLQSLKPLNSLEICLMAQLYKDMLKWSMCLVPIHHQNQH